MKLLHNTSHLLKTVFTIFLALASVKGDGGCKVLDFLTCMKNKTLTGHVIKSIRVLAPGIEDCQHKCYVEDNCVSYNLGPIQGMIRSCDLNDADHFTWPYHVVSKEGSEYCPIENRCSSTPCQSEKICVPDFSWDSFSCVDGVWTPWTSWTPCHDLPDCPRNRTRNCSHPTTPQNIGSDCSGSALDLDIKECRIPARDTADCETALGMEDSTILDSQITASSILINWQYYSHRGARLNKQVVPRVTAGAWLPVRSVGEYIQVDLGRVKMVTKIATQGRPAVLHRNWVTEYTVSYSNDSSNWFGYYGDCIKKFPGNFDKNTTVTNKFEIPIIARYIRVIVQKWYGHPALRMELYGCTLP